MSAETAVLDAAPVLDFTHIPVVMRQLADLSDEQLAAEGDQLADVIAGKADALWVEPRRAVDQQEQDAVRTAIERGIALLAVARPSGVTFGGHHWCIGRHVNDTCPGPGTWSLPVKGMTRCARGAHFTPRELAEELVENTLMERLNYDPERDGRRPRYFPGQVTSQKVCDPACGSGALLVAACRFIGEQLLRSWACQVGEEGREESAQSRAYARECALRCLYGADIDPTSVELARLALDLLAPFSPNPMLTRQIVCGDALVGQAHRGEPRPIGAAGYPPGATRIDWPTLFPEVYRALNPGFTAVVSNPPFLGGQKITGTLGTAYRNYLVNGIAGGERGSADLAAYFALRAHDLAAKNGTVGLIATNTLAEGNTREVGLAQIVKRGWTIYRAVKSRPWPGTASLQVCLVWTYGPSMARIPAAAQPPVITVSSL